MIKKFDPELVEKYGKLYEPNNLIQNLSANWCINSKDTVTLIENTLQFIVQNYKKLYEQCVVCKKEQKIQCSKNIKIEWNNYKIDKYSDIINSILESNNTKKENLLDISILPKQYILNHKTKSKINV